MKRFRMGELYRYARPTLPEEPVIDGLPNFHYVVADPGQPTLQLERGINAPSATRAVDGERLAVILLSSNEHKRGSAENPWHDTLAPDEGFARYFGDNKLPDVDPGTTLGNRTLLRQFDLHTSPDRTKRERAAPILLFRSSRKGFKEFAGLGLITGAQRVTQFSEKNGGFFTNYLFDLAILSLTEEDESLAMLWISDRRNPKHDAMVGGACAHGASHLVDAGLAPHGALPAKLRTCSRGAGKALPSDWTPPTASWMPEAHKLTAGWLTAGVETCIRDTSRLQNRGRFKTLPSTQKAVHARSWLAY